MPTYQISITAEMPDFPGTPEEAAERPARNSRNQTVSRSPLKMKTGSRHSTR